MRIFEVGPRDGLQNEDQLLDVSARVSLVERLVEAGARDVEIGSFVHPTWVPQMADTGEVARRIERREGVRYWALVPNMRGLERALEADLEHVAVFASASETHSRKNINRSIEESMREFEEVIAAARGAGVTVRAYISMVFGCPYEGEIDFGRVLDLGERFFEMGAEHVSLGDTIGAGTPPQVRASVERAIDLHGAERYFLHLHDTQGMAIANALVAWEAGLRQFDSAVGGIGGCPYAAGATGNVGTEDLLHLLDSLGADLSAYSAAGFHRVARWLERDLGFAIPSRVYQYREALDSEESSACA